MQCVSIVCGNLDDGCDGDYKKSSGLKSSVRVWLKEIQLWEHNHGHTHPFQSVCLGPLKSPIPSPVFLVEVLREIILSVPPLSRVVLSQHFWESLFMRLLTS